MILLCKAIGKIELLPVFLGMFMVTKDRWVVRVDNNSPDLKILNVINIYHN